MNKKGFTLIELLAVIIILAVIALIVTPLVINVVTGAKAKANEASIYGYADGLKLAVYDYMYKEDTFGKKPNVDKAWAEANMELNNKEVSCEGVFYNETYSSVLNKCKVSDSEKEYCLAKGKIYECDDSGFTTILEEVSGGGAVLTQTEIGNKVLEQFPNLALDSNGCAVSNNNYSYMGGCYLKGAQTSNYIWFSGFLYRIMGINSDGSIRLITEENVTTISYNAYNVPGNTNFTGSHAESWLNEYFISNLKGTDRVVESKFCQGATTDYYYTGRAECTDGTEITKKAGLISVDEYNLAGASTSYLNTYQGFYTLSPYNADSVWIVFENGNASSLRVWIVKGIRPVINVNSETVITKGTGTLSDNYILNEDKTINAVGKLNEKATSGEYVKLSDKLYRVVGKNNDGTTKLIYDGYYQDNVEYGINHIFTIESGIGMELNTYVLEWLAPDATTKNKIKTDSKWYQNEFNSGYSYTEAIKENSNPKTATIGLINVGEMLSGQSASILTKNYTVNCSNLNARTYWTLTSYPGGGSSWIISAVGGGVSLGNGQSGLRPVININSDVAISSGSGILGNPYEI